jgi:2-polyprenyl-3-methyl-5-hydroxy-6-metoxy-1,4-benzoquinol methylase
MKKSMYHLFASYYDQIFDFNPTTFESIFLENFKNALDLGCGTGRLTKVIHNHHIKALGIDLDEDMIKLAMGKYPEIQFEMMNMLDINQLGSFDLITCFGNTLPHINPHEFHIFFKHIESNLSSQGVFWIQVLNYDRILKLKVTELQPIIKDDLRFYRSYTFYNDYIEFKTRLEVGKNQSEGVTRLYPYKANEFLNLNNSYNLHVSCYGSLDMKPYDINEDYYLYVKVQKRL